MVDEKLHKQLMEAALRAKASGTSEDTCKCDLDYEQLKKALIEYYKPQNPVEEVLVERIAVLDWRLKRNVLAERKSVQIKPGKEAYLPPAEAFDRILKYDRTADRELHRAISALEQIRERKEKNGGRKSEKSADSRSDGDGAGQDVDHENESRDSCLGTRDSLLSTRDSETVAISESTLEALFTSSARVKILRLFFQDTQPHFYLREISAKAGVWLGTVQREISRLTDAGVLVKEASGQQTYYRINDKCPFISGLRSIFSIPAVQQGIQPSQSEAVVKQG